MLTCHLDTMKSIQFVLAVNILICSLHRRSQFCPGLSLLGCGHMKHIFVGLS
uniref:Uncharacterized protein n=1 Tax=Rhizophora mucronata TaxID=61149 RepID=A0A2P2KWY3_RHIMU